MEKIGVDQEERTILFTVTGFNEYGILVANEKEKKIVSAFYVNSKDEMKKILLKALELTEKEN